MKKILLTSAMFLVCCVLLSGCNTTSGNAAPKMKSHSSRVKELQKKYDTSQVKTQIPNKKYSYEDDKLKINLR